MPSWRFVSCRSPVTAFAFLALVAGQHLVLAAASTKQQPGDMSTRKLLAIQKADALPLLKGLVFVGKYSPDTTVSALDAFPVSRNPKIKMLYLSSLLGQCRSVAMRPLEAELHIPVALFMAMQQLL
jgi:hypothetical protein